MEVTRREALETIGWIGTGSALLTVLGAEGAPAAEPAAPRPPAYRGERAVKPLPFDAKSLKGISEKLIVSHHDNNYAGAVKRLNAIQQLLGSLPADAPPFQFGSLKREELLAANSVLLHERYFANLGGGGAADGAAATLLRGHYGSLDAWERDFRQTALALGGGSGWVMAVYDPADDSLHNWWSWDHMHVSAAGEPVLVLDMYEHAYQMDYGAAAKSYVDAFFQNVLWSEVNHRIERAKAKRG